MILFQLLDVVEPDNDGHGWTAKTKPEETAISGYEFDFLAIATGRQVRVQASNPPFDELTLVLEENFDLLMYPNGGYL